MICFCWMRGTTQRNQNHKHKQCLWKGQNRFWSKTHWWHTIGANVLNRFYFKGELKKKKRNSLSCIAIFVVHRGEFQQCWLNIISGTVICPAGSKHTFSHTAQLSFVHFHMFICRNLMKWLNSPVVIYFLLKQEVWNLSLKPNHPLPTTFFIIIIY